MNNDIVPGFDTGKDSSLRLRLQKIEHVPGCLAIFLEGYIDIINAGDFSRSMERARDAGFTKLIFDMSLVTWMASTAIAGFVSLLKTVKARSGDVVLLRFQPAVHEVLSLLGFAQEGAAATMAPVAVVFRCPICGRRLRAVKAGRFRCCECQSILARDATGQASLA